MQKQDEKKVPEAGRENWQADDLVKESVNEDSDETVRKVLRGDEEKGDPDDRGVVGATDYNDTPQGREESKIQEGIEKNGGQ